MRAAPSGPDYNAPRPLCSTGVVSGRKGDPASVTVMRCLLALCLLATSLTAWPNTMTVGLEPFPDLEQDPYQLYWKDISGASYPQAFIDSYRYEDAQVILTYETFDPWRFTGSLEASGLKPNFCYQMKLNGKPTALYGAEGDAWSNESIGYTGRWWREQPTPANSTDAEYRAHKDDPAYIFSGYLVFDLFVTDATGAATLDFTSDNSYHVVWKTSQRARGPNDGPVHNYVVGGTTVGLYGEWEPTRALPGTGVLRPGEYDVQFRLTEESFHDPDGFWAQVLKADQVSFAIAPEPGTTACFGLGALLLAWKRRRRAGGHAR